MKNKSKTVKKCRRQNLSIRYYTITQSNEVPMNENISITSHYTANNLPIPLHLQNYANMDLEILTEAEYDDDFNTIVYERLAFSQPTFKEDDFQHQDRIHDKLDIEALKTIGEQLAKLPIWKAVQFLDRLGFNEAQSKFYLQFRDRAKIEHYTGRSRITVSDKDFVFMREVERIIE